MVLVPTWMVIGFGCFVFVVVYFLIERPSQSERLRFRFNVGRARGMLEAQRAIFSVRTTSMNERELMIRAAEAIRDVMDDLSIEDPEPWPPWTH
jgi:hypothetical protein